MHFIFFKFRNSDELIYSNELLVKPDKKMTVSVYYELMDSLVTVPSKCVRDIYLKNCIYKESNKAYNRIIHKYNFNYS